MTMRRRFLEWPVCGALDGNADLVDLITLGVAGPRSTSVCQAPDPRMTQVRTRQA
jgi:hypothetical protein